MRFKKSSKLNTLILAGSLALVTLIGGCGSQNFTRVSSHCGEKIVSTYTKCADGTSLLLEEKFYSSTGDSNKKFKHSLTKTYGYDGKTLEKEVIDSNSNGTFYSQIGFN